MDDWFAVLLLMSVGALGVGCATIGLRTGTTTAFRPYRYSRATQPVKFWYGTLYQAGIGIACLVMAIIKALE